MFASLLARGRRARSQDWRRGAVALACGALVMVAGGNAALAEPDPLAGGGPVAMASYDEWPVVFDPEEPLIGPVEVRGEVFYPQVIDSDPLGAGQGPFPLIGRQ